MLEAILVGHSSSTCHVRLAGEEEEVHHAVLTGGLRVDADHGTVDGDADEEADADPGAGGHVLRPEQQMIARVQRVRGAS